MKSTPGKTAQNPFSPSLLNQMLKKHLAAEFGSFWLNGEVFEHYRSPAGHQYFTLKDAQSGIKCVMFRQQQSMALKKGMQLVVLGQLSMYTPKGDLQINVLRVMQAGQGDLAQQFEVVKQKLENAGLFDQKNKQTIPSHVNSLAVVTSKNGAALQDVLNILKEFNPLIQVTIYHTPVQGEEAAAQVNHALRTADDANHDVILLTRGGGSKEDLWCFNDEFMAHQIAQLSTPIISAVGHETDESISDLVADLSCITPSAAAQLIAGDFRQTVQNLKHSQRFLSLLIKDKLRLFQQQTDSKFHALDKLHPTNLLQQQKAVLTNTQQQLHNRFNMRWQSLHNHFNQLAQQLSHLTPNTNQQQQRLQHAQTQLNNQLQETLFSAKQSLGLKANDLDNKNPLNVLSRGYSITTKLSNKEVITDVSQVKSGDEVVTQLKSGKIHAKIFERLDK